MSRNATGYEPWDTDKLYDVPFQVWSSFQIYEPWRANTSLSISARFGIFKQDVVGFNCTITSPQLVTGWLEVNDQQSSCVLSILFRISIRSWAILTVLVCF